MREQEVLRLRRQGLTQVEVAARLGVSQAAVSGFEKNAKRKIADAQQTLRTARKLGALNAPSGERVEKDA